MAYSWGFGNPDSPSFGHVMLRCSRVLDSKYLLTSLISVAYRMSPKEIQLLEDVFMATNRV